MYKNSIFIFEFVSGGGFNLEDIPSSLFSEGYAMLRSIISDFKRLNFRVSTLLDIRINQLSNYIEADDIILVKRNNNYLTLFEEELENHKYCYIIAPESQDILYNLTKIAQNKGKRILSSKLEGIKTGSSKLRTYEFFQEQGVNTPITYSIPKIDSQLDMDFILKCLKDLGKPIIIKPEDGVGAENIFYFETEKQIKTFFHRKLNTFDKKRNFILQEFIKGEDYSVSLINDLENYTQILSINKQNITFSGKFKNSEYLGGHTPVDNYKKIKDSLEITLNRLDLSLFNGYFGIDFILTSDGSLFFIEINPRLTTSYVGIRKAMEQNFIEYLFNPTDNITEIVHSHFSKFIRIDLKYSGNKSFRNIKEILIPKILSDIPEIVTPPIALKNESLEYSCFVATKTLNLDTSENRIKEIRILLENYGFEILN